MGKIRPARIIARIVTVCMALLAVALGIVTCNTSNTPSAPGVVEGTTTITTITTLQMPSPVPTIENSLRLALPLPGTIITDSVTIQGEGRAFENTILVVVETNNGVVGEEIVTTSADVGEIGQFTTTVKITTPVQTATDGLVTIYTTSAKDGSVDQRASVPVELRPVTNPAIKQPSIQLSPDRGRAGTQVTAVGDGFAPGSEVQIRLGEFNAGATQQSYASGHADQHGAVKVGFTMPATWPNGEEIVQSQILVMASTPDFVDKATALFEYETDTNLQTTAP